MFEKGAMSGTRFQSPLRPPFRSPLSFVGHCELALVKEDITRLIRTSDRKDVHRLRYRTPWTIRFTQSSESWTNTGHTYCRGDPPFGFCLLLVQRFRHCSTLLDRGRSITRTIVSFHSPSAEKKEARCTYVCSM